MSVNISRAQVSDVDTCLGSNWTYGRWSNEVQDYYSIAINHRIPEPPQSSGCALNQKRVKKTTSNWRLNLTCSWAPGPHQSRMTTICTGIGSTQEDFGPECSNVLLDSRNLFSRCKADIVNEREHLQSTGICCGHVFRRQLNLRQLV